MINNQDWHNKQIANFNKFAHIYNKNASLQYFLNKVLFKKYFIFYYLNQIANNKTIKCLDVGSGTGFFAKNIITHLILKQKLKDNLYWNNYFKNYKMFLQMIDPSLKMCLQAKSRFCIMQTNKIKIKIKPLDIESFKTSDKYDICYSSMALQWSKNLETSIKKIKNIAKDIIVLIPIDSSFMQLKNLGENNDLFFPLPTNQHIKTICIKNNLCVDFFTKRVSYRDPVEFFKNLKNTGATLQENTRELQNNYSNTVKKILKIQKLFTSSTLQPKFVLNWNFAIITTKKIKKLQNLSKINNF